MVGAPDHGGTTQLERPLPTGTVTFLFTDIEGSTRLLRALGSGYGPVLAQHRVLMRRVFDSRGGREVHAEGDGGLVAFAQPADAVLAAIDAQLALVRHPWPVKTPPKVRMGLHTGEAVVVSGDYVGLAVNQAARVCAAGHGGQILVSEATRALVEPLLPPGVSLKDLGAYDLKDVDGAERLHQVVHPDLAGEFPGLRVRNVLPNNLPHTPSEFIGRVREIDEIHGLLSQTRLLTLKGLGGAGKTRLAIEVAHQALPQHPDGVWFADLSGVVDPAHVSQRVASLLAVAEEGGRRVLDTLTDRLRSAELLLVLDNCEHVLEAAAELAAALLGAGPGVRILATSRAALGVQGETTWQVPSMALPPSDDVPTSQLLDADAVRLFVARAAQVRPGFSPDAAEAAWIAQICRRLDGIPLAIELAAARMRVLTPAQIAGRLDDRFRLLSAPRHSGVARHHTLRATVDWSYDLLDEVERTLLRRLSVFAGPWTLEAAEGICAVGELEAGDVLDVLTRLVDRSLVLSRPQGPSTTYRLLETVRLYALERLRAAGEEEELGERFRAWYVSFAEEAAPAYGGREQTARLDRLETEHDNLRAVLLACIDLGEGSMAQRLAAALGRFWAIRGHLSEGRLWLWTALATGREPTAHRSRALAEAAKLTEAQGYYRQAREMYEESLAIARALGDVAAQADRVAGLGGLDWVQGRYEDAGRRQSEALALAQQAGDLRTIARCLHNLANVAFMQGNRSEARDRYSEALAIRREIDDAQGIAESLNNLGILARIEGDLQTARTLTEESLGVVRAIGHRPWIAAFSGNLGTVLHRQGLPTEARTLFEESLSMSRELGDRDGVAIALNSLGNAAYVQGRPADAVAAYEESLTLRMELGDRRGEAETLYNLGTALRSMDDLAGARERHEQSLAVRRELDDRAGISGSLYGLGVTVSTAGDPVRGFELMREALDVAVQIRDRARIAAVLDGLVQRWAETSPERAAVLLGAAKAIPVEVRSPLPQEVLRELEEAEERIRLALGDEAQQAIDRGRSLSFEELLDAVGTDP